ncbi:MAG: outer membrane protein assembly factor BamE [Thiobacillus sp.]
MSPYLLLPVLLVSLLAGCSNFKIGPHRIDVQQGNALDPDNLARLKPGLSRSQVRFLLGTPLIVDPFRDDRWDYVYVFHKAGRLDEQKRVSLFFEGDLLARIEGDLPVVEQEPDLAPPPSASDGAQATARAEAETGSVPPAQTTVAAEQTETGTQAASEPALRREQDIEQIEPGTASGLPESAPSAAASKEQAVLAVLETWAASWSARDEDAYFSLYAEDFVPSGGGSRAEWEKRRRLLMGLAKSIEVKIESPVIEAGADGTSVVTFNQYYRSDTYQDAVRKQLRMVERDGRWLIIEERVLSILRGRKS